MINPSFYVVLLINLAAIIISLLLEKFNKKTFAILVFPLLAFVDVISSFLVFADYGDEPKTMVLKLLFKDDFYLSYGFIIDKVSTTYLLILAVIYFCAFVFCYSFSIVGASKNNLFSLLSAKIFLLKLAILATGFFQFMIGMEMALLLSGVLIVNGRQSETNNNKFLSFLVFEIVGSLFIFIAFAIWLSIFGNDSFFINDDLLVSHKKGLFLASVFLWLFIWVKGALIIGNFVFAKSSMAHFPSFIVIANITFPLCFIIVITRLSGVLLLFDNVVLVFAIVGSITILLSAVFAILEKDISSSLAFLLSSQMGLMITVFALNGFESAVSIAAFQILASLLFFLSSGSLIEAFSSEYLIAKMGGVRKIIPATFFMMLVGGGFMIVPYTGVKFFAEIWLVNKLLLISCVVFSFAVSRIIICAFFGKTRAEDAVFARVQEKSFFILMSMSVSAIFLTTIFYHNYVYHFFPLRLMAIFFGILAAVYFYLYASFKFSINFSPVDKTDMLFFQFITLPAFKMEVFLKNKLSSKILNNGVEFIINKFFGILKQISEIYQKRFALNILFFVISFLLTLFWVVFYK